MGQPIYGLNEAALFPLYNSRQEYRAATGQEAPPYSSDRPPKNWFDRAANDSPRRNVVYDNVLATGDAGQPLRGPDGKPQLEPLILKKEEAATVNIYEVGLGAATPTLLPVPVPLRSLKPNEELQFAIGGNVVIRDRNIALPSENDGFTSSDRRLLSLIAQKLGINA